jgi:hypothetical protein
MFFPAFTRHGLYHHPARDASPIVSTHAQHIKCLLGSGLACHLWFSFPRIREVIRHRLLCEGTDARMRAIQAIAPRIMTVTKMMGSTPVKLTIELEYVGVVIVLTTSFTGEIRLTPTTIPQICFSPFGGVSEYVFIHEGCPLYTLYAFTTRCCRQT